MKNQGVEAAMRSIDNITEITQEMYDALCDKHGGGKDLLSINVVDEDSGQEEHEFMFGSLSSAKLSLANKLLMEERDMNGYNDSIIFACALNGKNILRTNDNIRRAIYKHVDRLVTSHTATVKKRKRTPKES